MYKIYKIISFLIYPLVIVSLFWRVLRGKENSVRCKEKLGFYRVSRAKGKLIWFHAASIGEFNAMLPVINSISEEYPEINLLVTTVTVTAANVAKHNLPDNATHQFAPLDCINIVHRFLDHWSPDLVIWTESEFWPNLLTLCQKRSKLLLINARLSERSFKRWLHVKSLAKLILDSFSLILAQSKETKVLLEKLGAENVVYAGNLKFVAANFAFNADEARKLKRQLKGRLVLMAASTHPGEEEMFALLQRNLKVKCPNLLTIVAPRHPNRADQVLKSLKQLKLEVITRTSKEKIEDSTDILLVNTVGEFGLFFHLTEVVCTGGSWCKIGHSFIEPAKLKNLIIFGSHMDNSREVANEFLERDAAIMAANGVELEKIMTKYIEDPKAFARYKENGAKIVDEMNQVKEEVLEKIRVYVDIL